MQVRVVRQSTVSTFTYVHVRYLHYHSSIFLVYSFVWFSHQEPYAINKEKEKLHQVYGRAHTLTIIPHHAHSLL